MNSDESATLHGLGSTVLPSATPLVWPEPRFLAQQARYAHHPPFEPLVAKADLIAGVLVGVADKTIQWLQTLVALPDPRCISLVVVVFPGGPTREEHLITLKMIQAQVIGPEQELDIRLLPVARAFGPDYETMIMPPTVFQAHESNTGRTTLCIGSVGDSGKDAVCLTSFNVVFQPDDALRDAWRRWFQYLFASAVPLTTDTVRIPHLAPAQGDPDAAEMWKAFEESCRSPQPDQPSRPEVDPKTGEVIVEADGTKVKPWDGGKTALDPLALKLQQVYAHGWLVTVDETTRIKPLAIPVKATLLGQQSERTLGTLTQKQSFSLQVLDEVVGKEVEKCRRVNDIMDLLTYLLSMGSHWLPEGAKVLFEKELEARNAKGLANLKAALGGDDVPQFVQKRKKKIQEDLDAMYNQLGQGKAVPADKLAAVFSEVQERLTNALSARITPRAVYNKIAPPDLTAKAPDESWTQPLSLLLRSARLMREALTDPYFPRRLSGLSFKEPEFQAALNIFGDVILKDPDPRRAKAELDELDKIETGEGKPKEKCAAVWAIVNNRERD
jgi:hypothetical protein